MSVDELHYQPPATMEEYFELRQSGATVNAIMKTVPHMPLESVDIVRDMCRSAGHKYIKVEPLTWFAVAAWACANRVADVADLALACITDPQLRTNANRLVANEFGSF